MSLDHDAEIDRNYEAFQQIVSSLMPEHAGQYALLRDQKVVRYFATSGQAVMAGHQEFSDGRFSVQAVIDRPLDLGFYSHVANNGQA